MHSLTRPYGFLAVPFGVLVGHLVGYRLAHPGVSSRDAALGSTHGYLGVSTWVALALAVVALGWAAREGARGQRSGFTAATLLRAQALSFVALEVLERIGSTNPIGDAAHEPGVWFGLAVQVVLALAASSLLRASATIGELFSSTAPPVVRRSARHAIVPNLFGIQLPITATGRGPPLTELV